MCHALVVATFGQRPHTRTLDVLRAHARHLQQRHVGAFGEHRIDTRGQVRSEPHITLRSVEAVDGAVVVDVEHIPRSHDDEGDIVARRGVSPIVLPALAEREVVVEPHRTLHRTRVVHAASVDTAVDDLGEHPVECRRAD